MGPSDSYQTRMGVSKDEAAVKLRRSLVDIRSRFDEIRENPIVSSRKEISKDFLKALTILEGVMLDYPECCINSYAEKGPFIRLRVYEEFLETGRDQSIPIEFWAVAHAPCSSTCKRTLELGRKYLDAVAEFSENLKYHVESRLLLPRFYQTGGARFVDLQPIDYDQHKEELSVSRTQFEDEARLRLPEPIEIVLCNIPRPYVLVEAPEEPPYKMAFPNPDMIGTMWLAYTPGFGTYMVNAKTGKLALYITSDKWIPKVGEEWRSKSNFRIYQSVKTQK
ncbi:MAG: DUF483 domain-containing protein [Thermoproteota archaeon]|nr:DUF483 domain-containing protein [Candidatus Brockarchaeota archaeon]